MARDRKGKGKAPAVEPTATTTPTVAQPNKRARRPRGVGGVASSPLVTPATPSKPRKRPTAVSETPAPVSPFAAPRACDVGGVGDAVEDSVNRQMRREEADEQVRRRRLPSGRSLEAANQDRMREERAAQKRQKKEEAALRQEREAAAEEERRQRALEDVEEETDDEQEEEEDSETSSSDGIIVPEEDPLFRFNYSFIIRFRGPGSRDMRVFHSAVAVGDSDRFGVEAAEAIEEEVMEKLAALELVGCLITNRSISAKNDRSRGSWDPVDVDHFGPSEWKKGKARIEATWRQSIVHAVSVRFEFTIHVPAQAKASSAATTPATTTPTIAVAGRKSVTSRGVSQLEVERAGKDLDLKVTQKALIDGLACSRSTCINQGNQCWEDDSGLHYALETGHIKTWSILKQFYNDEGFPPELVKKQLQLQGSVGRRLLHPIAHEQRQERKKEAVEMREEVTRQSDQLSGISGAVNVMEKVMGIQFQQKAFKMMDRMGRKESSSESDRPSKSSRHRRRAQTPPQQQFPPPYNHLWPAQLSAQPLPQWQTPAVVPAPAPAPTPAPARDLPILPSSPFPGEKKTLLNEFWAWRLTQCDSEAEEGAIRNAQVISEENFWRIIDLKDMSRGPVSEAYEAARRLGIQDGIARHLRGDLKAFKVVRKARLSGNEG